MKTIYKALGLVLTAFLYNTIQTSRSERTVKIAYEMGVCDGKLIERHNAEVKSRLFDEAITATKYSRYAKMVK